MNFNDDVDALQDSHCDEYILITRQAFNLEQIILNATDDLGRSTFSKRLHTAINFYKFLSSEA